MSGAGQSQRLKSQSWKRDAKAVGQFQLARKPFACGAADTAGLTGIGTASHVKMSAAPSSRLTISEDELDADGNSGAHCIWSSMPLMSSGLPRHSELILSRDWPMTGRRWSEKD